MRHRSFALIAGLLLLPALAHAGWGDVVDQAQKNVETQAQDTATGAAKDAVGGTGDSTLKAAAQEGVHTGTAAAANGADLGTAGKKGAAAGVNKALGADEAQKTGRVTKLTADSEGAEDAE